MRRYTQAVAAPAPAKAKAGAKKGGGGGGGVGSAPQSKAKPAAKESSGPSAAEVMERTVGIISTLVGRDVEAEEPLMDAGLDSLSGAELKSQMETAFGVELPETAVFDCRVARGNHARRVIHHVSRDARLKPGASSYTPTHLTLIAFQLATRESTCMIQYGEGAYTLFAASSTFIVATSSITSPPALRE